LGLCAPRSGARDLKQVLLARHFWNLVGRVGDAGDAVLREVVLDEAVEEDTWK
jgi:hypothetical protein